MRERHQSKFTKAKAQQIETNSNRMRAMDVWVWEPMGQAKTNRQHVVVVERIAADGTAGARNVKAKRHQNKRKQNKLKFLDGDAVRWR